MLNLGALGGLGYDCCNQLCTYDMIQALAMSYRNIGVQVPVRETNGYCIPRGLRNNA